MRRAGSPDAGANPRKRREDHVDDRAKHENQKGAVPIAEPAEEETENTIAKAEQEPTDETRSQQIARSPEKAKDGDGSKKAEDPFGGKIALPSKALQKRNVISDHQPCRKHQRQTDADINAGADSRVVQEVEPTIAGQM